MSERIENLVYQDAAESSRVEGRETTLFATGPTEFLCSELSIALAQIEPIKKIFGEYIDGYKRMDYPIRGLPALRIYNNAYLKQFESWFIEGDLVADMIFPANIRRQETQQIPDTLTAALLQQFRSPDFFADICTRVPGLNELGKRFEVDKSLAFEWGEELVPLTQLSVNFRLDLRQWDSYLELDGRTKSSPFERVLGDLNKIVSQIEGLRDDLETIEVDEGIDQNV